MENKLKKCPFCGGEAKLVQKGNDLTKTRSAEVFCIKCFAEIKVTAMRYCVNWCIDTVVEKWNRRANG